MNNPIGNLDTTLLSNLLSVGDSVESVAAGISDTSKGLLTGFKSLDDITIGLQAGELTIIGGRSSMGKSSLLIDILLNIGKTETVVMFSLEMSTKMVIQRMLANLSQISLTKMRREPLNPGEQTKFNKAIKDLSQYKILIDDSSFQTPTTIYRKLEQILKTKDVKLFTIDFLQLMSIANRTENTVQAIDEMTQQIRAISKKLQIPVIEVSQLNRKPEDRQGHEPRLSDLRASGGLEQVADVVLLLHRPSYYAMREIAVESEDNGEAYLLIAKNRNGPTGKIPLVWLGDILSFRSPNWTF